MLFDTRRFHQSGNSFEPRGGWLFSSSVRWPRPSTREERCVVNRAKAWKEIEKDAQVEERKKMGVMSVSVSEEEERRRNTGDGNRGYWSERERERG